MAINEIFSKDGMSVKVLPSTHVGDFFEELHFEVTVNGETLIDTVSSIKEINRFMYLKKHRLPLAEAYYQVIV